MSTETDRERRFRDAYTAHVRAVLTYAGRRCENLPDAADVVADTMLVAWRRIDSMPAEPDTRLWLFGVARNVISNERRGRRRRERLGERLREQLRAQSPAVEITRDDTADLVRSALHRLKPLEREVILLTVGEQLTPAEIAVVLQMNSSTVRTHLQRAREKLRAHIGDVSAPLSETVRRDDVAGHVSAEAHPAPRFPGPEEFTQ